MAGTATYEMRTPSTQRWQQNTKQLTERRATSAKQRTTDWLSASMAAWLLGCLTHWALDCGCCCRCCCCCWLFTYTGRYARSCVRMYFGEQLRCETKWPNCAERKTKNVVSLLLKSVGVVVERAECLYRHLLASSNSHNQWLTTAPKAAVSEPTACCAVASKTSAVCSVGVGRSAKERTRALLSANQISRTHKWAQHQPNEIVNKPCTMQCPLEGVGVHTRAVIFI